MLLGGHEVKKNILQLDISSVARFLVLNIFYCISNGIVQLLEQSFKDINYFFNF